MEIVNKTYILIISALVAVIPLSFWVGSIHGAKSERREQEALQLTTNANNAINTVSAIQKTKTEYKPVYIEVEKYVEAPNCPAPAVLVDTIKRLP